MITLIILKHKPDPDPPWLYSEHWELLLISQRQALDLILQWIQPPPTRDHSTIYSFYLRVYHSHSLMI